MRSFDPGWQTYATPVPECRSLKGVFHLQWLSLRLTKYFVQHDQSLPVVFAPDPNAIIDSILEQKQWEPNLTEVFVSRYNIQAFLTLHHRGPATKSIAPTVASSISSISDPTALPSASPGAPAEAASGNASRAGGSGTRVDNTHFNEALFGTYRTSSVKSKALRSKVERGELPPLPPSKANSSRPVCLAWHTKGQCNINCPHTTDHIAYSAEDYAPLAAWCRDHGYASL
jgi:hypothetical protein